MYAICKRFVKYSTVGQYVHPGNIVMLLTVRKSKDFCRTLYTHDNFCNNSFKFLLFFSLNELTHFN